MVSYQGTTDNRIAFPLLRRGGCSGVDSPFLELIDSRSSDRCDRDDDDDLSRRIFFFFLFSFF